MTASICVVAGVGPGNGAAFARRFAGEGYRVAMLARSEERLRELEETIPGTTGVPADVGNADSVAGAFERIRAELGPPSVAIHNAGSGVFKAALDTTPEELEATLRVNVGGLLHLAREAVPDFRRLGGGSLVAIGATASLRGGANTAPFAASKAGERSLAQSLARAHGPEGIHVAHVVVDGVIDMPRTRRMLPDKPDDFFLSPDSIAESVWQLVQQPRSAWTFELDLRPYGERW